MTKLDDLREFIRSKNKKEEKPQYKKSTEKQGFSLEVAGSDPTSDPMASFGTEETDPDLVSQVYLSERNRVPKGEGASYLDQD